MLTSTFHAVAEVRKPYDRVNSSHILTCALTSALTSESGVLRPAEMSERGRDKPGWVLHQLQLQLQLELNLSMPHAAKTLGYKP